MISGILDTILAPYIHLSSGLTQWSLCLMMVLLMLTWIHKKKDKPADSASRLPSPPGPVAWPVIGNLLQLGRKPHHALTNMSYKYGKVFQIQMGSRPTVVLNGIDVIKQACIKQAGDFAGRPDFYTFNFIANGKSMGFGDYGARWKMHRKIAQNALAMFVNDKDNPMEKAVQEEARTLVQNLLHADGPQDPHDEIYLSVGNIICALCFGKRYQREDEDFKLLVKMNADFMAYAGAGNPVDIMPWMRYFTKRSFNRFLSILQTMDAFCLKKRQEHLETYDPNNMRDVTDALIRCVHEIDDEDKARVGLTDEHILVTVQELIGAGFDTIATTLQWSLLFMATHSDVQDNVNKEMKSVIGNRRPTVQDIGRMPYTEAVILEIMRHSCIFPFALPHCTTQDTSISGHFISDKTLVFLNLWSVTHDPHTFPDPEKFDPQRFLDDQQSLRREVMENFLPFGAGRRRCPGEQLAKMEIFIFFTSMMQAFSVKTLPGHSYSLEPKYGLTLKPQNFKVEITPRNL